MAFFQISILLFVATNPLSLVQSGKEAHRLIVDGRISCTPTGNCRGNGGVSGGFGIAGVIVLMGCVTASDVVTTVGRTTTNGDGSFKITVREEQTRLINIYQRPLPCAVTVLLPVSAEFCLPISAAGGILASAVKVVGRGHGVVKAVAPSFSVIK